MVKGCNFLVCTYQVRKTFRREREKQTNRKKEKEKQKVCRTVPPYLEEFKKRARETLSRSRTLEFRRRCQPAWSRKKKGRRPSRYDGRRDAKPKQRRKVRVESFPASVEKYARPLRVESFPASVEHGYEDAKQQKTCSCRPGIERRKATNKQTSLRGTKNSCIQTSRF